MEACTAQRHCLLEAGLNPAQACRRWELESRCCRSGKSIAEQTQAWSSHLCLQVQCRRHAAGVIVHRGAQSAYSLRPPCHQRDITARSTTRKQRRSLSSRQLNRPTVQANDNGEAVGQPCAEAGGVYGARKRTFAGEKGALALKVCAQGAAQDASAQHRGETRHIYIPRRADREACGNRGQGRRARWHVFHPGPAHGGRHLLCPAPAVVLTPAPCSLMLGDSVHSPPSSWHP